MPFSQLGHHFCVLLLQLAIIIATTTPGRAYLYNQCRRSTDLLSSHFFLLTPYRPCSLIVLSVGFNFFLDLINIESIWKSYFTFLFHSFFCSMFDILNPKLVVHTWPNTAVYTMHLNFIRTHTHGSLTTTVDTASPPFEWLFCFRIKPCTCTLTHILAQLVCSFHVHEKT